MAAKLKQSTRNLAFLVHECYESAPPVNAKKIVEDLLLAAPPTCLTRLEGVMLWDTPAFKNHFGEAEKLSDARYIIAKDGTHPWIEICVDKLIEGYEGWPLRLPIVRDLIFSEALYHEVGHHIHRTQGPPTQASEAAAEEWRRKLQRQYLWRSHRLLLTPVLIFSKLFEHQISKWRESLRTMPD